MARLHLTIARAYELAALCVGFGAEGAEAMKSRVDIAGMDAGSALVCLNAWRLKRLELTEGQFDQLWDTVTEELGKLNDERYRLVRD